MQMKRMGNKILEVNQLQKSFGKLKIADDFTYLFKPGERIGVIGKNGVGKSTFLNMLQGIEFLKVICWLKVHWCLCSCHKKNIK